MSFLAELQRRNVFRMAVLYGVSSWLILQVADVLSGLFGLPDWSMRFVGFLLLLGFPLALVFSWIYELTPEGLKREKEVAENASVTRQTGRKLNIATVVLLAVAVGLFAVDRFAGERPSAVVGDAPTTGEPVDGVTSAPSPDEAPSEDSRSIAVLPFVNMSSDTENEYFSDGLTETLLHKLAQLSELRVAARTSSFAFKGTATDIREIAGKLDVANVLEGSVQRAGDRVRITAQLIQASDGFHLWSATYERNLDDIFEVQDEIAGEVIRALKGSLLGDESFELANDGGTDDAEAYDAYLRGLDAYRQRTEESLDDAVRLLRRALALDPGFALAWSALAEAIVQQRITSGLPLADVEAEVMAAAEKGVELAPELATTAAILGDINRIYWNTARALELLERAVALDPNHAVAWSRLADARFESGQFPAALESAQRAMILDPLDFELKADSTNKFMEVGRVQDAELLAQVILDNDPASIDGLSALADVYWRTGRPAKALEVFQRLLAINPNTAYVMDRIADSYISLGDHSAAARWLDRAAEINPVEALYERSWICRIEGDVACSIRWLEQYASMSDDEQALASIRGQLAMLEGDPPAAVTEFQKAIEIATQRGGQFNAVYQRMRAAEAADKAGDFEARNEQLAAVRGSVGRYIEEGSTSKYGWSLLAAVAALADDPETATSHLDAAIDAGFRDIPWVLHTGNFDKVLEDPDFKALLAELRESNFRELQAMRAVDESVGMQP